MSSELVGVIGSVVLVFLILLRVPVGLAMMLVGLVGYSILQSVDLALVQLGMSTFNHAGSYTLTVIPMYTLMGLFLFNSGLSEDLYKAVDNWVGKIRGSLAITTIGASAIIASISGAAMSTAAMLGRVSLPEMKRYDYDLGLSAATIAVGSTLGLLIPPSVTLILYGVLTMEPIGPLFLAGIVPGILLTLIYILVIYLQVLLKPSMAPITEKSHISIKDKIKSITKVFPFLIIFLTSIGGIYLGYFTPTEAGAIGAFGAFLITLLNGRLNKENFVTSLDETARITAMIFIMLLGANMFSSFLAVSRLPMTITTYVGSLNVSPYIILSIIVLIYLILGTFMEGIAIQVLTLPIVYPIIIEAGFNGIWFSIIFVLCMQLGSVTPPVGVCCYILHGVDKSIPLETIFRGVIPFVIATILFIVVLTIFPGIALVFQP